jgi:hypothetical protein
LLVIGLIAPTSQVGKKLYSLLLIDCKMRTDSLSIIQQKDLLFPVAND